MDKLQLFCIYSRIIANLVYSVVFLNYVSTNNNLTIINKCHHIFLHKSIFKLQTSCSTFFKDKNSNPFYEGWPYRTQQKNAFHKRRKSLQFYPFELQNICYQSIFDVRNKGIGMGKYFIRSCPHPLTYTGKLSTLSGTIYNP